MWQGGQGTTDEDTHSLGCSGGPSLLQMPGLWDKHQEQQQVWSGCLSLLDRLCAAVAWP